MNLGSGVHVLLEHSNRGKKSLGLDLSKPEGLDILYQLAARVRRLPHEQDAGRALAPAHRRRRHPRAQPEHRLRPRLGLRRRGPEADRGGYDQISYWCRGGSAMGAKRPGVGPHPDPACAHVRRLARRDDDRGRHRRRALPPRADGRGDRRRRVAPRRRHVGDGRRHRAVAAARHAVASDAGRPGAIRNPLVGVYRTKDDGWVAFSMLQGFEYWPEICTVIGRPELIDDPRFATHEALVENAHTAAEIVEAEILERDARRVEAAAREHPRAVVAGAGLAERRRRPAGACQRLRARDPDEGRRAVQAGDGAGPVRRGAVPALAAPEFNEHGDAILTEELGLDWDTVVDLKVKGVVA